MSRQPDLDEGPRMAALAKEWALRLTERPSVTGTPDETSFGPWLAEQLVAAFGDRATIWTLPVDDGDPRVCVAMLVRGTGRRTTILTGHYDTVATDDYGDLKALATQPGALAAALTARLENRAETAAEKRARDDLASGEFLFGRGLLDMKAGLAAGLAAAALFAAEADQDGTLLFLAVPDEENASIGARRAARDLAAIAARHGLDIVAAINLDAIADDGDGTAGRVVALGTVGKLLPTAFVAGLPTHAGFPLNGLNAAAIAAAIAAEVEWAVELTDETAPQPGTPPSLLMLRDGKAGYDVTTPATAFAAFNVLVHRHTPEQVMSAFEALCERAQAKFLAALRVRIGGSKLPLGPIERLERIPVLRYETVYPATKANEPKPGELDALFVGLTKSGLSIPEQCRLATERLWRASGLAGPAIVVGFGSIPYLPTELAPADPNAHRLARAARESASAAEQRHGCSVRCVPFFAGISDMSFFGQADVRSLDLVGRNTPVWECGIRWPETSGIAGVPTINAGPWGRDYHTPLERLHAPYAFEVLPGLILDIVRRAFAAPSPDAPRGTGVEDDR